MIKTSFIVVPVERIKVGNRFRKDMGDLDPLAQSIKDIDLLHPPVVNENYELIAGYRRLEACKSILGWTKIPVHVVNIQNAIDGEIQENSVRKDFVPSEMVAIKRKIEEKEKELARGRMIAGKPSAESAGGTTRERTAQIVSKMCGNRFSHDYLSKAEKIVEASEKDPEKYRALLQMVDERKISVSRAYMKLEEHRKKETPLGTTDDRPPSAATKGTANEMDIQFWLSSEEIRSDLDAPTEPNEQKPTNVLVKATIDMHTGKVLSAELTMKRNRDSKFDKEMRIPRPEPVFGLELVDCGEVSLAPHHTIVCGLTQESGKTTALEGFLSRWAGKMILVFICKSDEEIFRHYRKVSPFLRQGAYISELAEGKFDNKLELETGIQVMDLQNLNSEVQAAIIGSVANEILDPLKGWRNVVLVIPEAWNILPRKRDSAAKFPVETLLRQGATKGNFVVLDSQDISGIDVSIRRHIGNWIIGKQNEPNEILRAIEHLPIQEKYRTEIKHSIQTLRLGQFHVLTRGTLKMAFAWPAWMNFFDAIDCADDPECVYKIKREKGFRPLLSAGSAR